MEVGVSHHPGKKKSRLRWAHNIVEFAWIFSFSKSIYRVVILKDKKRNILIGIHSTTGSNGVTRQKTK